jgi:hypothetical protein
VLGIEGPILKTKGRAGKPNLGREIKIETPARRLAALEQKLLSSQLGGVYEQAIRGRETRRG